MVTEHARVPQCVVVRASALECLDYALGFLPNHRVEFQLGRVKGFQAALSKAVHAVSAAFLVVPD